MRCSIFILLMLREENSSRRESESMALLEKLIRLDSKDCNFHFRDDSLGYVLPSIGPPISSSLFLYAECTSKWLTRRRTLTTTQTRDC